MKYFDLKTKTEIVEDENKCLKFFYENLFGRIILKILTTKFIANVVRIYQNSFLSKHKIKSFIKKNKINMDEYISENFKSFNSFFMRKIKDGKRPLENGLISPCDSKVSVYKINNDLSLNIKNSIYTIDELIGEDASDFQDGYCIVLPRRSYL